MKSCTAVMAGVSEESSVTPSPITLYMSRSWPGILVSRKAILLGLSSLNFAVRSSISSIGTMRFAISPSLSFPIDATLLRNGANAKRGSDIRYGAAEATRR